MHLGIARTFVVAHFNVLHPIRVSASLRDARARLFELQRVQSMIHLPKAALIGAVTRDDDATLGAKQLNSLHEARREITEEASAAGVEYFPVTNAADGAQRVLELAA
jgi:hypothetical protein